LIRWQTLSLELLGDPAASDSETIADKSGFEEPIIRI